MNSRELSEKLDQLATELEGITGDDADIAYRVSQELRRLSNEKYAPGNGTTWEQIQPKNPAKKTYTDGHGKRMPF